MKRLCKRIRSNRLSLNGRKTKMTFFRNRFQRINKKLNFRVSKEKINPTSSVKYLGGHLIPTLTWNTYLLELIPKLNRTVGLLSKIRHYMSKPLLRTIYYYLFNSHLIYACKTWGQSKTELFDNIQKFQGKVLRIINFLPNIAPVSGIYKTSKILKIFDCISLWDALLVKNCFESNYPNLYWIYLKRLLSSTITQHVIIWNRLNQIPSCYYMEQTIKQHSIWHNWTQ